LIACAHWLERVASMDHLRHAAKIFSMAATVFRNEILTVAF